MQKKIFPFVIISLLLALRRSEEIKKKGGEVLRTAGSDLSAALPFIRPVED